jgi:hypothetical protein
MEDRVMDMNSIFRILLTAMLPAIWAAAGPVITTAVTAWVNQVVHAYVPRPIQLILSAVVTAVLAGLTGGVEGLDAITAAGIGAAMGLGTQTFASIQPATLLTTAPVGKK